MGTGLTQDVDGALSRAPGGSLSKDKVLFSRSFAKHMSKFGSTEKCKRNILTLRGNIYAGGASLLSSVFMIHCVEAVYDLSHDCNQV